MKVKTCNSGSNDPVSEPPSVPQPQPNQRELLLRQMVEVDTELLRWEALDVLDAETMGTVGMVAFWKVSGGFQGVGNIPKL